MIRFMRDQGFDALAFSGADWVEWATNHRVFEHAWERPTVLVVTADGRSTAFLSELSRPAMAAAIDSGHLWTDEIVFYGDSPYAARRTPWLSNNWDQMVAETLKAAGLGAARIGADSIPAALAKAAKRMPEAQFTPAGSAIRELRWVKHADEIATFRAVADLSDWAMELYKEELRPGRLAPEADHAVAGKLIAEAARRLPNESFTTTSVFTVSGPAAACIYGDAAGVNRRLENDTLAVSQISARLNGLQMELARPWIVGSPGSDLLAYLDCCLEAQEAAIAAAIPGRPVSGIQTAAQAVIDRRGLSDHFALRYAHGIGVIMHDFPENLPFEDRPLQEGEAYAVEPGFYGAGIGGCRFADVIVVRQGEPERITKSAKDISQLRLGVS